MAEIIIIPDHEQFGNEEECGRPLTYDMLNWHMFWADGTEVDSEFETYFKNMLRAMINLQNIKIVISIDSDLEYQKFVLRKVWAEFTMSDGTIIFPKNYEKKDNGTPVGHIWQLFTGLTGNVSKNEWIYLILRKLKNEYTLLQDTIKKEKKILKNYEKTSEQLINFLLMNNF